MIMRRYLFLSLGLATSMPLLPAGQVGGGLSEYGIADRQLYQVYWALYRRSSPAARRLLRADEVRWVRFKDSLPLEERIRATYNRIALLEQL
jgi:uncharacterized protein YecT (DUF1311 family)